MTLREARCAFSRCLCELVLWACEHGWEVALDEVTERITHRDPSSDHMRKSLHHEGLAADLNLYRAGVWLHRTDDHAPLGARWEQMGQERGLPLAWGGRFEDGNHYSLAWEGRR